MLAHCTYCVRGRAVINSNISLFSLHPSMLPFPSHSSSLHELHRLFGLSQHTDQVGHLHGRHTIEQITAKINTPMFNARRASQNDSIATGNELVHECLTGLEGFANKGFFDAIRLLRYGQFLVVALAQKGTHAVSHQGQHDRFSILGGRRGGTEGQGNFFGITLGAQHDHHVGDGGGGITQSQDSILQGHDLGGCGRRTIPSGGQFAGGNGGTVSRIAYQNNALFIDPFFRHTGRQKFPHGNFDIGDNNIARRGRHILAIILITLVIVTLGISMMMIIVIIIVVVVVIFGYGFSIRR
mmetsp:Transcript_1376/g.3043  ORF Transcript_1376/g.3043 Transcript_1376/m.3043 type:complete len:297 (-) Transcript_1376:728-1618(-)